MNKEKEIKMDFEILKGKTLVSIETKNYDELMIFKTNEGETYELSSGEYPDSNVVVYIESIDGNLDNLLNTPILQAEVTTKKDDNCTWSFYKMATIKGYVTIRWNGDSYGDETGNYYSEEVEFRKIIKYNDGRDFNDWALGSYGCEFTRSLKEDELDLRYWKYLHIKKKKWWSNKNEINK